MTLVPGSQFTYFAYNPNLAANGLCIAILSICLLGQLTQVIWYRTWDFMGPMLGGILDNTTLILGPAFLAASIYLCMGHLVRVYGEDLSALRPRTYLLIFVACDLVKLILQGLGGGICSTQQQPNGIQAGIDIVIAGLATQAVSLFIFICCCMHFASNVRRRPQQVLDRFRHVRETWSFHAFLFGVGMATVCIFTRSVLRIAELRQGFTGPLANSEIHFMVWNTCPFPPAFSILVVAFEGAGQLEKSR
ncbi:uncharacterized protein A1O9_07126 [Exophiala aquamarina CBS 119918]|uniref:Uncharacterized protein n=1 Tax=Exophiala aquamarina CBS 119918 TaxID=1182545 RepID=A0A072PAN1_9EURO|nr:uncharacterized protein A1O9_07126 [Exophiala aquamarina CBS 119918]KEF56936.1 hypothetical protein A1O9_07126 [Exophiala aquamarina CBS 119918]